MFFSKSELNFLFSTKVRHWIRPRYGPWFYFSIALWEISYPVNLQKLATSGTDTNQTKNVKVCQYSWRVQNVSALMYQIWLRGFLPIQMAKNSYLLWFLAVSRALICYKTYFSTKINCEKSSCCTDIAPSLFANQSSRRHFLGLS